MFQYIANYFLIGEYSKIHIKIQRVGLGLNISFVKHEDFIEELMTKLREFPDHEKNEKEWVAYAFTEAFKGANNIFFQKGNHSMLFWLNRKKIVWDYYHSKKVDLKLFYALMGALVKFEFVRYPFVHGKVFALFSYPEYYTYYEKETDVAYEVKANFENHTQKATEFVQTVFAVIYKEKKEKLRIWVG